MKTSKEIFIRWIDERTREWWETLSKSEAHPFHATQIPWQLIAEDAKWSMYGQYVDHLRSSLGKVKK